jgi:hypothetical protein
MMNSGEPMMGSGRLFSGAGSLDMASFNRFGGTAVF